MSTGRIGEERIGYGHSEAGKITLGGYALSEGKPSEVGAVI